MSHSNHSLTGDVDTSAIDNSLDSIQPSSLVRTPPEDETIRSHRVVEASGSARGQSVQDQDFPARPCLPLLEIVDSDEISPTVRDHLAALRAEEEFCKKADQELASENLEREEGVTDRNTADTAVAANTTNADPVILPPSASYKEEVRGLGVGHLPCALPDLTGFPSSMRSISAVAAPQASPAPDHPYLPHRQSSQSSTPPHSSVAIEVEATLVSRRISLSRVAPVAPLINSVPLPQMERSWWMRNKVLVGIGLGFIIGVMAAAIAALSLSLRGNHSNSFEIQPLTSNPISLPSNNPPFNSATMSENPTIVDGVVPTDATSPTSVTSTTTTSISASTSSTVAANRPTMSPTSSILRNLCVNFTRSVFDTNCLSTCSLLPGIDGDTAVVAIGEDEIQFYSMVDDHFDAMTSIDIDYKVNHVAVSGDVTVVGAPSEDNGTGAVYVYRRSSVGVWRQTARLVPSNVTGRGASFGAAVSVYNDLLVVGASYFSTKEHGGFAYIYRYVGSTWELDDMLTPEASMAEWFGCSVSVRGDLVAVGAFNYVHVYGFDSSSHSWLRIGEPIAQDDCDRWFGVSVVLTSRDGVVVGCSDENKGKGAVYYYNRNRSGNEGEYSFRQKITGSEVYYYDYFGGTRQISADGDVMAIGTHERENGEVYVFQRFDDEWKEVAILNSPEGSGEYFGSIVVMSENTILVFSSTNVYIYAVEECA